MLCENGCDNCSSSEECADLHAGPKEKRFKFIWLTKQVEYSSGPDVATAFTRLGYGADAAAALYNYEEVDV